MNDVNKTARLEFRLTNAYLFVAVLQQNQEALCLLIAALLHIKREEILSVKILNPIVLGQSLASKDCILDLLLLLNDQTKINLEMQVTNEHNWDNRNVYYMAAKLTDLPKIRQQCERQEKFERDRISAINFGIKAGLDKGKAEAKKNIQKLLSLMSEAGEDSLILEMAKDPSLLDKMYQKYHLD